MLFEILLIIILLAIAFALMTVKPISLLAKLKKNVLPPEDVTCKKCGSLTKDCDICSECKSCSKCCTCNYIDSCHKHNKCEKCGGCNTCEKCTCIESDVEILVSTKPSDAVAAAYVESTTPVKKSVSKKSPSKKTPPKKAVSTTKKTVKKAAKK